MEDYEAMLEKTKADGTDCAKPENTAACEAAPEIEAVLCEAEFATEAEDSADKSDSAEEPTLIGWLWRMCIPIIPCAGIIIYIVLLCIWAFGGKETETMRTWAKAALIATVIQLVILAAVFLVVELNTHILSLLTAVIKKI